MTTKIARRCSGRFPFPPLLGKFNDTLWSLTMVVLGKADVTQTFPCKPAGILLSSVWGNYY